MEKSQLETERIQDNGISAYHSVWVVFKYGDTEIDQIYLKFIDAEKIASQKTSDYFNYFRKSNKKMSDDEFTMYFKEKYKNSTWKATLLADAIDQIREYTKENCTINEEEF